MANPLNKDAILTCAELCSLENNSFASVAGFVIVKQMPSTAKGTVFLTLEDETGNSNIIIWKNIQEKFREALLRSQFLMVKGFIEKEGIVIHIIATELINLNDRIKELNIKARNFK